jgi:hypothetical protein
VSHYLFENVTGNHTIEAVFDIYYAVSVATTSDGNISPSGLIRVFPGSNLSFTISPNTGYAIRNLYVNSVPQGAVTFYSLTNIQCDYIVFAAYNPVITASAGANGSISPSGAVQVYPGNSQSFTFTPESGYRVRDVVVDGVSLGAPESYTFSSVHVPHTISATFEPDVFTITSTCTPGGTVTPIGVVTLNRGAGQHYEIRADLENGYEIKSILVDGVAVTIDNHYDFSGVAANHTLDVTFGLRQFEIRIGVSPIGGSVSPAAPVYVEYGGSQTFTITPDAGYVISAVYINGQNVGAVSSCTISNVTSVQHLDVVFSPILYGVSVSATSNGTVSCALSQAAAGTTVTLTVTPAEGYALVAGSLKVNGTPISGTSFVMPAADVTITAEFVIPTYSVTAAYAAHGTITVSTHSAHAGDTITVTLNADADYVYESGTLAYNGIAITGYTFVMPAANVIVTATFVELHTLKAE